MFTITGMYGDIDFKHWGTAEKWEDDPYSEQILLKDFMHPNTSIGQRNMKELVTDPPSIKDMKWFLYGERD